MANTEAFYRFHRFNESFDRDLKVTFGALEGLRTGVFPRERARTNLPIGKEPWRKLTSLEDAAASADSAILQIATMGIVRSSAALEDFLTTLEADCARTAFTRKAEEPAGDPPATTWLNLDIPKACLRMGMDPALVEFAMPLHQYFNVARNCIVHRNGRASAELEKISHSKALLDCLQAWPTKRGAPLPQLPEVREGEETAWLPRHAILCVSVYYKVASVMNNWVAERLGRRGFVYMAAHYSLLNDDPVDAGARRSAESVVLALLHGRYRFQGAKVADVISILRDLDKWKACLKRFAEVRESWCTGEA